MTTVIMLSRSTPDGDFRPIYTSGFRTRIEAVPNYLGVNEELGWEKFRVQEEEK